MNGGSRKRLQLSNLSGEPADMVVNSYDLLDYLEEEKYNLLNSGREWYGDHYKTNLSGAYPFTIDNLITSEPLKIRVTAAGRSNEESSVAGNCQQFYPG